MVILYKIDKNGYSGDQQSQSQPNALVILGLISHYEGTSLVVKNRKKFAFFGTPFRLVKS